MLEIMPRSAGRLVGVHATGRLARPDYDALLPKLEALFAEHGTLDMVFYMDDKFEGWDLAAAWDDAALGLHHRSDFGRLAVVGGPEWVNWCIRLSGFLMKGEIRIFPGDQLEEAWTWAAWSHGN